MCGLVARAIICFKRLRRTGVEHMMAAKEETGRKGISEPPSPLPRQVTNPIDILAHDHSRQEWLIDVPLHHENEELGLFPLLSRRAAVADNIDAVIRQLNREHMADDTYANDLI